MLVKYDGSPLLFHQRFMLDCSDIVNRFEYPANGLLCDIAFTTNLASMLSTISSGSDPFAKPYKVNDGLSIFRGGKKTQPLASIIRDGDS